MRIRARSSGEAVVSALGSWSTRALWVCEPAHEANMVVGRCFSAAASSTQHATSNMLGVPASRSTAVKRAAPACAALRCGNVQSLAFRASHAVRGTGTAELAKETKREVRRLS